MKKTIFIAGTITLIVLMSVTCAFFVAEFEARALNDQARSKAQELLGINLKSGKTRLSLARGLVWEDVGASSSFPGGSYDLQIERVLLEHRWLPLLAGQIVVRRVVLEKPEIEVRSIRPGPRRSRPNEREEEAPIERRPSQRESSILDLALVVSEIRLNEGSVTVRGPDGNHLTLAIEGLELGLDDLSVSPGALTLLHALTATGEMRARAFMAESTHIRDLDGAMRLDRGRVGLDQLAFATDSGKFVAQVNLDFNSIPASYEMNVEGSALDVQHIAGLERRGGLDTGSLNLDVEGFGLSAGNVRGKGVLKLEAGRLPPHPILTGVEKVLETVTLSDSSFEDTEVRFRLGDNRFVVNRFHLDAGGTALDLTGVVRLDGPVELNLAVRYPQAGAEREALFRILGTLEDPQIERIP
jgi:hypothetical protein